MPKGIIISNISDLYHVETDTNEMYQCRARGKLKTEDIKPVTGDIVEIEITDEQKNEGIITKIAQRKNYTKRPKMANLSQIILVVSMKLPKPDLILLDKQLAYAEYMGIKPIICLNKIDLVDQQHVAAIENVYKNIGYKIITTNAKTGESIDKIQQVLQNNITAFSGNSGVGKSTLINAIFKQNVTQEGHISQKNRRGKNTTTQVQLYKINSNSYIADTPGFSTFSIEEIESQDLCHYFKEFVPYIANCEFASCNHIKEENCGIKQAIEEGKITQERYERYCKIWNELKEKEENQYK